MAAFKFMITLAVLLACILATQAGETNENQEKQGARAKKLAYPYLGVGPYAYAAYHPAPVAYHHPLAYHAPLAPPVYRTYYHHPAYLY